MLTLLVLLIAAACFLAFHRWRWGVLAAIAVGLLQDPIRKMVPGAPAYLVMASLPVWLAAMAAAGFKGELNTRRFINGFPRLGRWIRIFAIYLLLPAAISATYGRNSWLITLLGVIIYGLTFLAIVAGWRYPDRRTGMEFFMLGYGVMAALMLAGGPLEAFGLQERFPMIGTERLGHIWVTYRTGTAVHMLAGFFRSPDVMGWHASLVFMVAVIMAFRSRGAGRWLWIGVAAWGVLNIWLCGRRKMLSMIPIFTGAYLLLVLRFSTFRRIVSVAATALMIGGLGWYIITTLYHDEAVERFYLTTIEEAEVRVQQHGIRAVISTVRQAGFWGYGLGMSQQGVHNLKVEKPHLWQEGGAGKLVAELGIPGAVLYLLLWYELLMTAYHVIRLARRDENFFFTAGIASILVANLSAAVVSAQIFGDPLVALLLAFLIGLLFSAARGQAPPGAAGPAPATELVPRPAAMVDSKAEGAGTA